MAITITKPEINLREKLKELDFQTVPFQKMPSGSVLQVVQGATATSVTTTSVAASWINSGLSASITPTSDSSKVLIICNQPCNIKRTSTVLEILGWRLMRGTTPLYMPSAGSLGISFPNLEPSNEVNQILTTSYLDSPSTTSLVTYETEIRLRVETGSAEVSANNVNGVNSESTITLMEIAG